MGDSQRTAYIAVAAVLINIELMITAKLLVTAKNAKVAIPVAAVQIASDLRRPRRV
jgi:hypothetical protein